ncbi:MAG: phosphatidate cytidylyltransferase [Clostridia bacterium]|nr:phosphatidate cytidylyltransferase [Clostridia bacterium]
MKTRIITSVIALLVFFGVVFAGELAIQIAVGVVILFMLHEVYCAMTKSKAVMACGFMCCMILMAGIRFRSFEAAVLLCVIMTMLFLIALHGKVDCRELFGAMFMTFYITVFTACIVLTRHKIGLKYMIVIFLIAWVSDSAAYFTGTFFGKHKLIPNVSPKKTVEGALGAVIVSGLACVLYVYIARKCGYVFGGRIYPKIAVLGVIGSIASQIGDLAASAVKRDTGIKDYGRIFPGHGGFMDRFDSVIFIAPIVYFYCWMLIL